MRSYKLELEVMSEKLQVGSQELRVRSLESGVGCGTSEARSASWKSELEVTRQIQEDEMFLI